MDGRNTLANTLHKATLMSEKLTSGHRPRVAAMGAKAMVPTLETGMPNFLCRLRSEWSLDSPINSVKKNGSGSSGPWMSSSVDLWQSRKRRMDKAPTTEVTIEALAVAVSDLHDCKAFWLGSVPVKETFQVEAFGKEKSGSLISQGTLSPSAGAHGLMWCMISGNRILRGPSSRPCRSPKPPYALPPWLSIGRKHRMRHSQANPEVYVMDLPEGFEPSSSH